MGDDRDHHDDPHAPPGPHTLPDPPIDADVDLRHLDWMKLDIRKLYDSRFWKRNQSRPEVLLAGLRLWMTAWYEVPAGSLPADDEDFLLEAAGISLNNSTHAERTLSERSIHAKRTLLLALAGFERHNDGRMYHKYLVELVSEVWATTIGRREGAAKSNEIKKKKRRAQRAHSEHQANAKHQPSERPSGEMEMEKKMEILKPPYPPQAGGKERGQKQAPASPAERGPASAEHGSKATDPQSSSVRQQTFDNASLKTEFGYDAAQMVDALWTAASASQSKLLRNAPKLDEATAIIALLRANPGMSFREDVLPAITSKLASYRGDAIGSWAFFANVAQSWFQNRQAGRAQPGGAPVSNGHTKHPFADKAVQGRFYGGHSDIEWYDACVRWQTDGTWDSSFSPALPGHRGSSCPDDVLAALGIVPGEQIGATKPMGAKNSAREGRPEVISGGELPSTTPNARPTSGLPTGTAKLVVPEGGEVPF